MSYEIEWKTSALREFKKLPADVRDAVEQQVEGLAAVPRPSGCRKLAGFDGMYRIRVGDYRLIYEIEEKSVCIFIVRIRHRGESYRNL